MSRQVNLKLLITGIVVVVFVAMVAPLVFSMVGMVNSQQCVSIMEKQGYVVLAAGEYTTLNNKIDALKVSADAAVVNAEAAALAAQTTLDILLLHNENEVFLYPDAATKTVTFTAGAGVDTWGTWAEITDSGATTLSSKFVANDGYLVEIMTHDYSIADKIFMIEISYGAAKTVVGRTKVRSDWTYVQALRSVEIPTGETIYYRMQSETANATLLADFRYYYE